MEELPQQSNPVSGERAVESGVSVELLIDLVLILVDRAIPVSESQIVRFVLWAAILLLSLDAVRRVKLSGRLRLAIGVVVLVAVVWFAPWSIQTANEEAARNRMPTAHEIAGEVVKQLPAPPSSNGPNTPSMQSVPPVVEDPHKADRKKTPRSLTASGSPGSGAPVVSGRPGTPTTSSEPIVAIHCELKWLPFFVKQGEMVNVVLLNKKLNAALKGKRGFFPVTNPDRREPVAFPTAGRRSIDQQSYIRCEIDNVGSVNLLAVSISLQTRYDDDSTASSDTIFIDPLLRGDRLPIAIVNECPESAQVMAPRLAYGRVEGREESQNIPLRSEEYLRSPVNSYDLQGTPVNPTGNGCQ